MAFGPKAGSRPPEWMTARREQSGRKGWHSRTAHIQRRARGLVVSCTVSVPRNLRLGYAVRGNPYRLVRYLNDASALNAARLNPSEDRFKRNQRAVTLL